MTRIPIVLCLTVLALWQVPPPASPPRPDFSGTWAFDMARSSRPSADGKVVIAKLLGDEVTIRQDAAALKLAIRFGDARLEAAYALDGTESRNASPEGEGKPDTIVSSRASWDGVKLVIRSTSTSESDGRTVTVETTRVLWLDADGALILDRTGTPVSEVPPSRSVYKKARISAARQ